MIIHLYFLSETHSATCPVGILYPEHTNYTANFRVKQCMTNTEKSMGCLVASGGRDITDVTGISLFKKMLDSKHC